MLCECLCESRNSSRVAMGLQWIPNVRQMRMFSAIGGMQE